MKNIGFCHSLGFFKLILLHCTRSDIRKVYPIWSPPFSVASELLSLKSPSRWENTDISLCFLWRSSTSCFRNHRQKGDMQAVSAYSQTHEYYLAKLAQHWEMNEMMSNHTSIPAIANYHIGNILFLHLQTAILWLVCEVCKAGRQHDSLAEFPLSPQRRPLGPETA